MLCLLNLLKPPVHIIHLLNPPLNPPYSFCCILYLSFCFILQNERRERGGVLWLKCKCHNTFWQALKDELYGPTTSPVWWGVYLPNIRNKEWMFDCVKPKAKLKPESTVATKRRLDREGSWVPLKTGGEHYILHSIMACKFITNFTPWTYGSLVVCKVNSFIDLVFYVTPSAFMSTLLWWVVLWAEETGTYSWSRFCTVNCRPMASNYQLSLMRSGKDLNSDLNLFIYLGFNIAFNTVWVISRRVVLWAEETSTYSWSGFCTVNCRPPVSNYQLSHIRSGVWTCRP